LADEMRDGVVERVRSILLREEGAKSVVMSRLAFVHLRMYGRDLLDVVVRPTFGGPVAFMLGTEILIGPSEQPYGWFSVVAADGSVSLVIDPCTSQGHDGYGRSSTDCSDGECVARAILES